MQQAKVEKSMVCPKCGVEQTDGNKECIQCGIIFRKIHVPDELSQTTAVRIDQSEETVLSYAEQVKNLLFSPPADPHPLTLAGRSVLLLILIIWGARLFSLSVMNSPAGESYLHLINLPFHEAGHIIFRLFGEFMAALGGTLGQLIMPLICMFTFLIKTRDPFASSVALWWFGQNFIDIAPYINDARDLNLVLIGGRTGKDSPGIHDWEYLLGRLNILSYDHCLAGMVNVMGIMFMIAANIWGVYLLYKDFRVLRSDKIDEQ
jgi:hypothetical protein